MSSDGGQHAAGVPTQGRGPTLWIVHRDDRGRQGLARLLAGSGAHLVAGSPSDDLFESSETLPAGVLLGLSGDYERELDFVHRVAERLSGCAWMIVAPPGDLEEARRLFDRVPAEWIPHPPEPLALRRCIHRVLQSRRADPLSRRYARDQIAARFAHWFANLEIPDLIRTLDPHLASVPILILGEPGTGRGLLARYIHEFGGVRAGRGDAELLHVPCDPADTAGRLLGRITDLASTVAGPEEPSSWTLWLEDVDRLEPTLQRLLASWVEFGLPPGVRRAALLRWVGTAQEPEASPALDGRLVSALGALSLRVPPLRDRPESIAPFVADTTRRWCRARGQRLRRIADDALGALRSYPWPGNLAELEAVVERSLAGSAADPLRAEHLRFAPAPLLPAVESPPEDGADPGVQLAPEPAPAAESPAFAEPARRHPSEQGGATLRRALGAVAHEVRNPLTSIRTFSELLRDQYDDPDFRERFSEVVRGDVQRIERVLRQLDGLAEDDGSEPKTLDVAALLEELLEARRDLIRSRGLLVLRELDRSQPTVLADPAKLEPALAGLLDRTLELVTERGDVYLASRHHPAGPEGGAAVRILLRFDSGGDSRGAVEGVSPMEASLELVVAESVVRAHGGSLTVDAGDGRETVVVIDLPAPDAETL